MQEYEYFQTRSIVQGKVGKNPEEKVLAGYKMFADCDWAKGVNVYIYAHLFFSRMLHSANQ